MGIKLNITCKNSSNRISSVTLSDKFPTQTVLSTSDILLSDFDFVCWDFLKCDVNNNDLFLCQIMTVLLNILKIKRINSNIKNETKYNPYIISVI